MHGDTATIEARGHPVVRVSEAASLALHAMVLLASSPAGAPLTVSDIAKRMPVSAAHLAKVLQRLGRAGLVAAARGPHGGYVLAVPADEVTLLRVYETVEGPIGEAGCLFGRALCPKGSCLFGGLVESVQDQVRDHLARTRLSDVAR